MAAAERTDHALERLIFFSDAVFAIAITLLIIDIRPPHLAPDANTAEHLQALADLIPNFLAFAISFAVIGLFWMGHHRAFALASHYAPRLLGWNLGLLGVIVFMPFVTGYLSANSTALLPTSLYCATMLVAGLFNLKVNFTVTGSPIVSQHASSDQIAHVRRRGISVALGAATAFALSFLGPHAGLMGLFSIVIWRRILERIGPYRVRR